MISKKRSKNFLKSSKIFIESQIGQREKFELWGISDELLDKFEEVNNWKYVFINTSTPFEDSTIGAKHFPHYHEMTSDLHLYRATQLEYLVQLGILINKYAQFEFFSQLDLAASDLGEDEQYITNKYIKAEGKYITADKKVKADVYLIKFKVEKLLRLARVSRYEGIPFILDDDHTGGKYQRLLIASKLRGISKGFLGVSSFMAFPNTLTLVASNECEENADKLKIPLKYGSMDIIDGQHRLYAYTNKSVTQKIREDSEILASVIKFRTQESKLISQYSAKVFCDINANQAKVKNNLIYLIKYDVLGDRDYEAIAGKILLECDRTRSKALSNMFLTNSLKSRTSIGTSPIPITTIVDNDLVAFLKGMKTNKRDYFRS